MELRVEATNRLQWLLYTLGPMLFCNANAVPRHDFVEHESWIVLLIVAFDFVT